VCCAFVPSRCSQRDFFLPWNPTNWLDVCSFDVVGLWRIEREREREREREKLTREGEDRENVK
jgi:hypothetical protein